MLGKGYVIDCVLSAFSQKQKERVFKAYVTDCLKHIAENTAKMGGGGYITARFDDLLNKPTKEHKKGEIAKKIKSKLS